MLADAGYGDEMPFRDGVAELGLLYAAGGPVGTSVWARGTARCFAVSRAAHLGPT
jgi:SRSO17 transposase